MPIDEPTYTHPVRHILIVDDSPIVAGAHARTLRARGHQVEVRHSQAEGFALLAERARFDVVVLDVDLEAPGAGFEIGRRFLARGLTRRLIFCTGTEDPRQALLALRLGIYVPKGTPSTMTELITAIERDFDEAP